MWSYGITAWEILTKGTKPFHGITNKTLMELLQSNQGARLDRPPGTLPAVWSLLQSVCRAVVSIAPRISHPPPLCPFPLPPASMPVLGGRGVRPTQL